MRAHKATKRLALTTISIWLAISSARLRGLATCVADRDIQSPFLSTDAVSWPVLRVVGQVCSPFQTPTHLNVSGQGGPNHGPGGDSNDQKPPDHPHDALR